MKAVKNNHIEIIKMLLSAGADSDPIDKDGNLAYDLIKDRNTEIQSLFQKRNEEIDNYYFAQYKPMKEGVFATDEQAQAYFKSVEETKKHIEEQKNIRGPLGNTPLLFAVKIGNSYLKDLITASNINMVDPFQKSALMIAVTKNKPEAVKQLIATGADVNYKDRFGQTSLLIAQENGFTEIADLLKSAGAKE
ncbi:MAG: ankyrin repeat domain-containing protein, partial [Elusimicrobiaceae bacterium]|nr:ankyrin repeat domain-containing protein [Elusimicrobiaceae bacterium]